MPGRWFDENAPEALAGNGLINTSGPVATAPLTDPAASGAAGRIARNQPGGGAGETNATNPVNNYTGVTPSPTYTDPSTMITALLAQGVDPNSAVDQVNAQFNLPNGQSYAYYAPGSHGPGSGAVIGVPGGGYLAPDPSSGQWNFNQGDKGAYVNPASNNVTPFSYQPFTDQFSYPSFQAPTGVTEQNDPGFEARLQLGADTLQHSAAAKGTLLSGQTANDLNQYAQNFASNEYANVYGRAAQTYATNYANALQTYGQKWNQYQTGFQNALSAWGANANLSQTNWQNAFNLANQQFGMNQQNWQNQYNTAALGLNAANDAANAGSQYANQAGNLITGAGNAGAAGTIGAGNAYNSALGTLANYGMVYPYLNNMYQQPPQQPGPWDTGYVYPH